MVGARDFLSSRWDTATCAPHAGQEWRECPVFCEDFSVTTNGLGTPAGPHRAALGCLLSEAQHYPAADHEPAKSALAKLLATTHDPSSPPPESSSHPLSSSSSSSSPDDSSISRIASKLLIGNGASELVDLLVRLTDQPKC
eukprot:Selendium_serpulae@DN2769_c0_g1_i1.p1